MGSADTTRRDAHTKAHTVLARSILGEAPLDLAERSLRHRSDRWLVFFGGSTCRGLPDRILDRVRLVLVAIIAPIRSVPSSDALWADEALVFDDCATTRDAIDGRKAFVRRVSGATAVGLADGRRIPIPRDLRTVSALLRAWRWGLRMAWAGVLDTSSDRLRWIAAAVRFTLVMLAGSRDGSTIYVFQSYNPAVYTAAAYMHVHSDRKVVIVPGSTPLHSEYRFTHLDAPMLLCSRVQVPEYDFYHRAGTLRSAAAEYVGNELGPLPAAAPTRVQVAFFSSGCWARLPDGTRCDDFARVGRELPANRFWQREWEILRALADACRANDWTLCVYAHPWERNLRRDRNIEPPYLRYLEDNGHRLDIEPGDSREHSLGATVAVTMLSTMIWDRIDAGNLRSLCFFWGDPLLDVVSPEAIGDYSQCLFDDVDRLEERVAELLGVDTTF